METLKFREMKGNRYLNTSQKKNGNFFSDPFQNGSGFESYDEKTAYCALNT